MHMKFLLLGLLSSGLLWTVACKKLQPQDQKLINRIETEIQTWQAGLGQYEAIATTLENFQNDVDKAIPSQPGTPADSLKISTNTMTTKAKAAIVTYKESVTTLTNRLAEYKAGTATKEALQMESKAVTSSLSNMSKAFSTLQAEQVRRQEEFSARQKHPASR